MRKLHTLGVIVLCVAAVGLAFSAAACTVPVFRYALERWRPDPYSAVLFHKGQVEDAEEAMIKLLDEAGYGEGLRVNLSIHGINVSEEEGAEIAEQLLGEVPGGETPVLAVVCSSGAARGKTLWSGAPTAENLVKVIDSPARREIAQRLMEGDSGVWILLESGDEKKDDAAAKAIEESLAQVEERMQLPQLAAEDMRYLSTHSEAPELKLDFSLMRMRRDDPKETFLIETLLSSEPDLKDEKFEEEPMAFPVFGRGRVLYAYVGEGINEQNIFEACSFLGGECSCQVKDLNPGMDLLVAADWDGLMGGYVALDEALPALTGFSHFADGSEGTSEEPAIQVTSPVAGENTENETESAVASIDAGTEENAAAALEARRGGAQVEQATARPLAWNSVIAMIACAVVVAGISLMLWLKRS